MITRDKRSRAGSNAEEEPSIQSISLSPQPHPCHYISPFNEPNKFLLEFLLSSCFLEVVDAAKIIHNITRFAKVHLQQRINIQTASEKRSPTSCNKFRIFISISSIIFPMLVICDAVSCKGQSCSVCNPALVSTR